MTVVTEARIEIKVKATAPTKTKTPSVYIGKRPWGPQTTKQHDQQPSNESRNLLVRDSALYKFYAELRLIRVTRKMKHTLFPFTEKNPEAPTSIEVTGMLHSHGITHGETFCLEEDSRDPDPPSPLSTKKHTQKYRPVNPVGRLVTTHPRRLVDLPPPGPSARSA